MDVQRGGKRKGGKWTKKYKRGCLGTSFFGEWGGGGGGCIVSQSTQQTLSLEVTPRRMASVEEGSLAEEQDQLSLSIRIYKQKEDGGPPQSDCTERVQQG